MSRHARSLAIAAGVALLSCSVPTYTFIPAPTPVTPMSTAMTDGRRPTFAWTLSTDGDGATGARVEVFTDRACTHSVSSFDVPGTSGAPSTDLVPGTYFWRLRGLHGTTDAGLATSAVREIFVRNGRETNVSTTYGTLPDFNGDGLTDVIVPIMRSDLYVGLVFFGVAGGAISTAPSQQLIGDGIDRFTDPAWSGGDVNGDGIGDALIGENGSSARVFLGSLQGITPTAEQTFLVGPGIVGTADGVGDLNGDGFGDIVSTDRSNGIDIYLGGANGIQATPSVTIPIPFMTQGRLTGLGDMNGDGYSDFLLGCAPSAVLCTMRVYFGAANLTSLPFADVPPPSDAILNDRWAAIGDVDRDGMSDLAVVTGAMMGSASAFTLHIYHGARSGPPVETWPATTTLTLGLLDHVQAVGDVNADGLGDYALLGTHVALALGMTSSVSITPVTMTDGTDVRAAHDLNHDGFDDVIVTNGSVVEVFLGSAHPDWSSGGIPLQAQ